jgi:hypothetical protein
MEDEADIVHRLRSYTHGAIYYDLDRYLIEAADEIERLRKERDEARQENKELLWMLDKRRSSPDCHDLHHEFKHQNHGDICPVLTQYNTLARKYGV